jgi:hypothetical protein
MIRDITIGGHRLVHSGTFLIPEGKEARFVLHEEGWELPIVIFWGASATALKGAHMHWFSAEGSNDLQIHFTHVPEQRTVSSKPSDIATLADGRLYFWASYVKIGNLLTLTLSFLVSPTQ